MPSIEKGVNAYLVVSYNESAFLNQLNQSNTEILAELRGEKETSRKQINIDSQGFDRFSYTNNNPVKFTDSTGHCLWDLCIIEIGVVSIGIVELAAVGGTVALAAYIYGPNGDQHIESLTNSIISSSEQTLDSFVSLAKGEYVPPGLVGAERDTYREALHRYKDAWGLGARDNVPKDILDEIAKKIKEGYDPEDAADAVDGPPEADDIGN